MSYRRICGACGATIWMVRIASGDWRPFDCENENDKPNNGTTIEDYFGDGFTSHLDVCPDALKKMQGSE